MTIYYLLILLSFLWFVRTIKYTLFYLYLWQLKEYHVGRFLDHFRTDKGRGLFLNKVFYLKVLMAVASIPLLLAVKFLGRTPFLIAITIIIFGLYIFETFLFFKNIFGKSLKKPVFTKKALLLCFFTFLLVAILYAIIALNANEIYAFAFWLLIIDIFIPFIVSLAVLSIQPIVVLYRNNFILNKAKEKILKRKDLIVIGITGSYGKTSAKEFLGAMLSSKFNILKTNKHQNSEMGISQCILRDLKPEHRVFIVEMGSYGVGGIKLLADIARPRIGILTGINEQHLSLYKSQANIIKTKYELIESLPKDGLAVFNGDNKYCLELFRSTNIPKKLYRLDNIAEELVLSPDIWTKNVRIEKNYVSFTAVTKKGESAEIKANVLGAQNISNILAAITVAYELGMTLSEISKAASKITPDQGSMVYKKGRKDLNILDASYSSNPDGVLADLDYLKIWPNKKIVIMPCMIELGVASGEAHKRVGKKIGEIADLAIITSSERFEELKEGALSAGMKPENILLLEKPEEILMQLNTIVHKDDAILLEGRVPKKVIDNLYEL